MAAPRVLIVAENISSRFGGEAFLPLHYFEVLAGRGFEVYLLTHERVQNELLSLFPQYADRMTFIPDNALHIALWKTGRHLPASINQVTLDAARNALYSREERAETIRLVQKHQIDVVHQPIPVSPRRPSSLYDVGAPVVIGPMNGNMNFPPGFADFRSFPERLAMSTGRLASEAANRLSPGKLKAHTLLVSNPRTRAGLPAACTKSKIVELVENGVDLRRFSKPNRQPRKHGKPVEIAFVGRLVDWKAVDLLLRAFAKIECPEDLRLNLFGDGAERTSLEALARDLKISPRLTFHGFLEQQVVASELDRMDMLVLPSLYECGGAVVLEAMAKGLPIVATDWGGPADYLDESCGILVPIKSRDQLISDLAEAILRLAQNPQLGYQMGEAGRRKVEMQFDWERKIDSMVQFYSEAARSDSKSRAV